MSEAAGFLNQPDLIAECADAISCTAFDWIKEKNVDGVNDGGWLEVPLEVHAKAVIDVLRKRGLITEQGLDLIKSEETK